MNVMNRSRDRLRITELKWFKLFVRMVGLFVLALSVIAEINPVDDSLLFVFCYAFSWYLITANSYIEIRKDEQVIVRKISTLFKLNEQKIPFRALKELRVVEFISPNYKQYNLSLVAGNEVRLFYGGKTEMEKLATKISEFSGIPFSPDK